MKPIQFIYKISILLTGLIFFITGVASATTKTSTGTGNWNTAGTWSPSGVPAATDDVIINSTVTLDVNANCASLTINSGKTFKAQTFTINIGGNFTNNGGTFTYGTSTINFNTGVNSIIGGTAKTTFYNLTINKTTTATTVSNSALGFLVNNNLTVTQGNMVLSASGLTHYYIITGNVSVAAAGTFTHDANYDNADTYVQVDGNLSILGTYTYTGFTPTIWMNGSGTLNINTGTTSLCKLFLRTANYYANGPVTIDQDFYAMWNNVGGSFHTNGQTVNANWGLVNNGGTVYIDGGGSLTVGNTVGGMLVGRTAPTFNGDVQVSLGTLNITGGGLYLGNGAAGTTTGTCTQSGGTINIAALDIGKSSTFTQSGGTNNSGMVTLDASNSNYNQTTGTAILNVIADLTNNGIVSTGTGTDLINIGGNWINNLTFTTSSTNTVTFNGSGPSDIGGSVSSTFNKLTINYAAGVTMSQDQTVNSTLTLTAGNLTIGSNNLILGSSAAAVAGSPFSANNMIVADGGGEVRKNFSTTGTYFFPIGDGSGTSHYSPISLNYTSGTFAAGAYSGVKVTNAKHPNNASTTDYLNRYWTVSNSGITSPSFTVSATYLPADVSGTEGNITAAKYTGALPWVKYGVLSANTLTTTAVTNTGTGIVFSGISNQLPLVTIPAAGFCAGGSVVLSPSITNGTNSMSYSWSPSTGLSSTTIANPTANPAANTTYTLNITDGNGFTSTGNTSTVTVNALPVAPTASVTSQPTCAVSTGTITITAPTGTGLTYSTDGVTYTNTTGIFSVMNAGNYNLTVKNSSGCTSSITSVTVNAQPATPVQPTLGTVTQPTCAIATGSFTISNYNATYTYTATPSTGVTISGSTVTAPVGSYTITATSGSCSSVTSTSVTVNAQPATPVQPTLGTVTQPTCAIATGSFTISNYNASYTYTATPSTGVTISGSTVTAPAGTYTITATSGSCSSVTSASKTVNAQPATPVQPTLGTVTQPTCATATGSFTISNYNASYTYTASPSTGVTISGSTVTAPAGTYTITATSGSCSSVTSASVTVNAQPATPVQPTLGTVTQPTCATATGSFTISNYNASYTYTATPSTGVTISGSTVTAPAGTYTITATSGSCSSVTSASVTVNAQPATPVQPTLGTLTQPTCAIATGSFTISNYNASYTYTATPSTGVTISGSTVTAPAGTYTITATSGSCSSVTSANTTVNAQPATPSAPTITAGGSTTFCAGGSVALTSSTGSTYLWSTGATTSSITVNASGSYSVKVTNASGCQSASSTATAVTVNALPVAPTASVTSQPTCAVSTGTITITAPTGTGLTYSTDGVTYTNTTGIFSGMNAGNYNLTVKNSSGCTSSITSVTVNAQPATPATPTASVTSQPTCTVSTGTITITAPTGTGLTYSTDGVTYTNTTGIFSGMNAGNYNLTVKNSSGCTSSSTSVTVNAQPATPVQPTLGTVTQPTCAIATGSFTISNYNASYTYTATPSTGVTISGSTVTAPAGSYKITATSGSCSSVTSTSVTVNAQPATPVQPTLGTVTQPTCAIATGSFTISNYNASYTYTATPSTGVTISGSTVTAPAGSYTITATSGSCSSVTSASKTVNAQPATPVQPTLGTVTQPTCATATGSFTISNYNATYTYTASPSTGVTISGSTVTAPAGTYTITATSGSCSSVTSASKTVNAQPATPVQPTLGTVTQPTCAIATGSFTISDYSASYTYTATPSTGVTISGSTVTAPAGSYTITATSGCTSVASTSATVNALIQPSATISYSGSPFCPAASNILPVISGTSGGVFTSTTGLSIDATSGTISLASSSSGVYTITYTIAATGSCTTFTTTTSITILASGSWSGVVSTDWNDPSNWVCGPIPNTDIDVTIAAGLNFYPVLASGTGSARNITVQSGASLTVSGGTLQISGTISNSGNLDATNGTIEMNGPNAQTIDGSLFKNKTIENLVVNNMGSGLSVSSTAGDTLKITGLLSFGNASAVLNTGDNITLVSNSAVTAAVGVLGGINSINGAVIVERYVNTGTAAGEHPKSWQFLAAPTTGQSIKESWMENGSAANYYGAMISGPAGVAAGFDVTSSAPSMKYYNYVTGGWTGVANTSSAIANTQGYMVFVRGDRTVTTASQAANPTVLRTKGTLNTGTLASIIVHNNNWGSIGNPYASPIDFTLLSKDAAIDNKFYVLDPYLYGSYGTGGYQTMSAVNNWQPVPGGTASYPSSVSNSIIQSGQAFFVRATSSDSTGTSNVNFMENCKTSNSGSAKFSRMEGTVGNPNRQFLRASLITSTGLMADGNVVAFDKAFSNGIDGNDALKMLNSGENFSVKLNGQLLIIDAKSPVSVNDTISYYTSNLAKVSYKLVFAPENIQSSGVQAFLVDKFLGTEAPVSLTDSTFINITVTTNAASSASDRFQVVFRQLAALPVTVTSVTATLKSKDVVVNWNVQNESGIQQYQVEKSTDGIQFIQASSVNAKNSVSNSYTWTDLNVPDGTYYYRIKIITVDGKTSYTQIVKVIAGKSLDEISVYPNPIQDGVIHLQLINQPEGNYGVRLFNSAGQLIVSKKISHANGTSAETIVCPYLAKGIYQLEVIKTDGSVEIIKVMN